MSRCGGGAISIVLIHWSTDAKEDTKDWRKAQEKIDAEVGSIVKVTYLMAGKMGVDVPLD